jgi:hypothetical protein
LAEKIFAKIPVQNVLFLASKFLYGQKQDRLKKEPRFKKPYANTSATQLTPVFH